jgi:hypothetical protein
LKASARRNYLADFGAVAQAELLCEVWEIIIPKMPHDQ